jgi:ribokinase
MMGAGAADDLASAARAAAHLAQGFASVVVTAGGKGLAMQGVSGERLTLPAMQVPVAGTHGAGDCFTGTLAASLARGASLDAACRVASEAAARHVATPQ